MRHLCAAVIALTISLGSFSSGALADSGGIYKRKHTGAEVSSLYAKERARIAARRDRDSYRNTEVACGAQVGVVNMAPRAIHRGDIEINVLATTILSYCNR